MKTFTIRQVANGFLVQNESPFARHPIPDSDMNVFVDWPACSKWLGDQFRADAFIDHNREENVTRALNVLASN